MLFYLSLVNALEKMQPGSAGKSMLAKFWYAVLKNLACSGIYALSSEPSFASCHHHTLVDFDYLKTMNRILVLVIYSFLESFPVYILHRSVLSYTEV